MKLEPWLEPAFDDRAADDRPRYRAVENDDARTTPAGSASR
jgi:hypothetical protein